jgi:hypothetical protein
MTRIDSGTLQAAPRICRAMLGWSGLQGYIMIPNSKQSVDPGKQSVAENTSPKGGKKTLLMKEFRGISRETKQLE